VRVISLLRSTVAGPRRRPVGVLAILTVIVGVVIMHSMSGSPTMHSHAVPHEATVVVAEQDTSAVTAAATAVVRPVAEALDGHGERSAGPARAGDSPHAGTGRRPRRRRAFLARALYLPDVDPGPAPTRADPAALPCPARPGQ
jgi:hypothetical protein